MNAEFRWNEWNLEHATQHGVSTTEAESVVNAARPPYPEEAGEEKLLVIGRGQGGRSVQIVYIPDKDGTLYIIHARPLTPSEKKRLRRRKR
jgi:uncharacterized DUF497 family protein